MSPAPNESSATWRFECGNVIAICNEQHIPRTPSTPQVPLIAQTYFIHWWSLRNSIFCVFDFCSWSRPRNYFNSEIFPIYGSMSQGTWSDLYLFFCRGGAWVRSYNSTHLHTVYGQ